MGLRYINVIRRSELGIENQPWKDLISPGIIGLLGAVEHETDVQVEQTVAILRLDDNKSVRLSHGLSRAEADLEQYYLIDNDIFTEKRLEVLNAEATLDSLHHSSRRLFRACITDRLHEALEPANI